VVLGINHEADCQPLKNVVGWPMKIDELRLIFSSSQISSQPKLKVQWVSLAQVRGLKLWPLISAITENGLLVLDRQPTGVLKQNIPELETQQQDTRGLW
jgi:hypothetical protein